MTFIRFDMYLFKIKNSNLVIQYILVFVEKMVEFLFLLIQIFFYKFLYNMHTNFIKINVRLSDVKIYSITKYMATNFADYKSFFFFNYSNVG